MIKKLSFYIVAILAIVACNGQGGKINKPYDGGHGIGIDTATIHQIEQFEDSLAKTNEEAGPNMAAPKSVVPSPNRYKKSDNMRGFDPASEDDMDDNGMSRYMENTDDEGWD